jgi:hypothetical protein
MIYVYYFIFKPITKKKSHVNSFILFSNFQILRLVIPSSFVAILLVPTSGSIISVKSTKVYF